MFVQTECASFLLASTRSHWALLRWHKQPSARMPPQRHSEDITAVCPSEQDVGRLPPFCGAGLTHCPALPPPSGAAPSVPWPQHPQVLPDTPCHHAQVQLLQAWFSGVPLRLRPAAASCGGQSNPRPSAISKKTFQRGAPGRTSHIVPEEMHTSPKGPWTILRFLKVLAQPLCCSQGYREFLLNCHRHLTVRNCLHHSGGSHGPFQCCARS